MFFSKTEIAYLINHEVACLNVRSEVKRISCNTIMQYKEEDEQKDYQ